MKDSRRSSGRSRAVTLLWEKANDFITDPRDTTNYPPQIIHPYSWTVAFPLPIRKWIVLRINDRVETMAFEHKGLNKFQS